MPEFHVSMTMFFDPHKVLAAAEKANYQALSKAGAFVRQRARHSIRKTKKISQPGEPPRSHSGDLRTGIWFGYDASRKTVVVGPRRYNMVLHTDITLTNRTTVPELLEFGGKVAVIEMAYRLSNGKLVWVRRDLRRYGAAASVNALRANAKHHSITLEDGSVVVPAGKNRTRTVTIAARPYMAPALRLEAPKFPGLWANSVKP